MGIIVFVIILLLVANALPNILAIFYLPLVLMWRCKWLLPACLFVHYCFFEDLIITTYFILFCVAGLIVSIKERRKINQNKK